MSVNLIVQLDNADQVKPELDTIDLADSETLTQQQMLVRENICRLVLAVSSGVHDVLTLFTISYSLRLEVFEQFRSESFLKPVTVESEQAFYAVPEKENNPLLVDPHQG